MSIQEWRRFASKACLDERGYHDPIPLTDSEGERLYLCVRPGVVSYQYLRITVDGVTSVRGSNNISGMAALRPLLPTQHKTISVEGDYAYADELIARGERPVW